MDADSESNGLLRSSLRLRGLRFISDDEIEMDFEGFGTSDVTFRVFAREVGDVQVVSHDTEFRRLYRGVPCLSVGHSLDPLLSQMFKARRVELPTGQSWERALAECLDAVGERARLSNPTEA